MNNTTLRTAAMWFMMSSAALAQGHKHGDNGPNGGPMQDIVGVHAELLVSDRTLTIHVYDESGKPVPTAGFSGSALVGSGQTRQVVPLAVSVDNALSGTASAPVAKGAPVTLQLKTPNGKTGQAKY